MVSLCPIPASPVKKPLDAHGYEVYELFYELRKNQKSCNELTLTHDTIK